LSRSSRILATLGGTGIFAARDPHGADRMRSKVVDRFP